MKMVLKEEVIQQILDGECTVNYQCVECRKMHTLDMKGAYVAAMDHFDELEEPQQVIVSMLKHRDHDYKRKRMGLQVIRLNGAGIAKPLEIGTKVMVHSLKSKDNWNGEIAHIIGNKVIKNGVTRWPIQLMLPPKERAMLKPDNFYSLDRERNRSCRVIPKDLQIGAKVRLHGLQITGEKEMRNGVARWP